MMRRLLSTLLGVFIALSANGDDTAPARPATLETKDHQTLEGLSRFEGDRLLMTQGGAQVGFKLAEIKRVTFGDSAAPPAEAVASAGGLKAEYFDDQELHQPKLIRYDPSIDFRWGLGAPDPGVAADFSARWTGRIDAKYSETYTFFTHANDGVRVWIDGKIVIDQWFDRPPFDQKGTVPLTAGGHDLRVEYHNQMAEASMQLAWSSASQARQTVPASRLGPPLGDVDPPWRVSLVSPAPDRWKLAPPTLELQATVMDARAGATTQPDAVRVDFYSGPMLLGSATTRPYRCGWARVPPGHHKLTAKAVNAAGTVCASPPVIVDVAGNGSDSLPAPWGTLRIGTAIRGDGCTYSGGLFTIRAAGGELRAATDSGYFLAQPLEGDGQITARIGELVTETTPSAVAGVMIRESLSGDARSVALLAGKEGGEYVRRWEPGSWVAADDLPRTAPCYVRLVRTGDNFKAYFSENGGNWQLVRTDQLVMGRQTYVGLIASSRSDESTSVINVDHLQVTPGSVPMDASVPGVRTVGGSFLAGEIRRADTAAVVLGRRGEKEIVLPCDSIARLVFHPLPTEVTNGIPRSRPGVLLSSGDFLEGDFKSLRDGRVGIDSVVFGDQNLNLKEVLAISLHDVAGGHHPEVRTRDGSVYAARSIVVQEGKLVVDDEAAGSIRVTPADLVEVKP